MHKIGVTFHSFSTYYMWKLESFHCLHKIFQNLFLSQLFSILHITFLLSHHLLAAPNHDCKEVLLDHFFWTLFAILSFTFASKRGPWTKPWWTPNFASNYFDCLLSYLTDVTIFLYWQIFLSTICFIFSVHQISPLGRWSNIFFLFTIIINNFFLPIYNLFNICLNTKIDPVVSLLRINHLHLFLTTLLYQLNVLSLTFMSCSQKLKLL